MEITAIRFYAQTFRFRSLSPPEFDFICSRTLLAPLPFIPLNRELSRNECDKDGDSQEAIYLGERFHELPGQHRCAGCSKSDSSGRCLKAVRSFNCTTRDRKSSRAVPGKHLGDAT